MNNENKDELNQLEKKRLNAIYGTVSSRTSYGLYVTYYGDSLTDYHEMTNLFASKEHMMLEYKRISDAFKKRGMPFMILKFKVLKSK